MQQPLDMEAEPRLKKNTAGADPPLAEHPFFWAAYMLVDSGQLDEGQAPPPPPAVNVKPKESHLRRAGDTEARPAKHPSAGGPAPGVPEARAGQAHGRDDPARAWPAGGRWPSQRATPKAGSKKPPTRSQRKAAKAARRTRCRTDRCAQCPGGKICAERLGAKRKRTGEPSPPIRSFAPPGLNKSRSQNKLSRLRLIPTVSRDRLVNCRLVLLFPPSAVRIRPVADQTATSSVSPVRMRIAPLSSATKILPSPT